MLWTWGYKSVLNSRPVEGVKCESCGNTEKNSLFLYYLSRHIWYILRWATGKKYFVKCAACGAEMPVETKIAESNYGGSLVGSFDRHSWKVFGVLVVLAIVAAFIADSFDEKRRAEIISTPTAGDIYVIDSEALTGEKTPAGEGRYTLIKLVNVTQSDISFVTSKNFYSKKSQASSDVRGRAAKAEGYFERKEIGFPKERMARLANAGGIVDSVRP